VSRRLSLLFAATVAATAVGAAAVAPAAAAPSARPAPAGASSAAVPDELLVGYDRGATSEDRSRARGRVSARFAERVVAGRADRAEVERVRLPQGKNRDRAIAELRSDPAVAYAEPNWVYTVQGKPAAKPGSGGGSTATPDYFANGSLWGMYGDAVGTATLLTNSNGSQAAEAWSAGHTGSAGIYVGVIDEGIQFTHPDLDANVWTNPFDPADGIDNDGNGYVDDVRGWDFANGDSTIYDGGSRGSLDDHGTHVAGTIGAKDGTELGVKGVNHDVTMISGKFLGRNGGSLAAAVQAIDYFTDLKTRHGLNIVATNNSWGGGGFSQALLDGITRANAADILFVAAAGNSGTDNDATPSYPSGYAVDNVIAVAAITKTGALASFSQYGATTVDLGAPGADVWSTTAFNGYSSYNGTSMATPHVTGGAALYAASNPLATATQIKAALLESAVPTASLAGKTATGGRLDVSGF
jgi:subtilisin family serine protease